MKREPTARISKSPKWEASMRETQRFVSKDSSVGAKTDIGRFTSIEGESVLGAGVKVGNCVTIRNSEVGRGTTIGDGAVIEDSVIGEHSYVGGLAKLRTGAKIGDHSVFGALSSNEGKSVIGNHTTIHSQCHIAHGANIGDWVFIAPLFCGANTPRIAHGRDYELKTLSYTIKDGARIAIGVLLLPGVTIGREALIGAGALVTKDIPDYAIAFGSPAVVKGEVPREERINWGRLRRA